MASSDKQGRFTLIRELNNPEDLLVLEGSGVVLASNMGGHGWVAGGFHLIDIASKKAQPLVADFSKPAKAPFEGAQPPPVDRFSSHGIAVQPLGSKKYHVLAVNHGGRHSVEAFELDLAGAAPTMVWIGGVELPHNQSGNAVAHLPGGGFAVTVTVDAEDPHVLDKARALQPCGFVFEWDPARGWSLVPGSEIGGDNGLVASVDGKWLYICGYFDGKLHKLSRGRTPYQRSAAPVGFFPDNVRFSPSGGLLVTGHPATTVDMVMKVVGSETILTAPLPTAVSHVDAETLDTKVVLVEQHTKDFGGGTSAIVVGNELWIGSFRGLCVATIPLAELGNPAL
ncbi:hypothetical protein DFJ74DRAFT_759926 [Hyaloraphidium curvatum]|nr:hypothetical protein DFJ74DRAFT_759926 [Hyaloraphidium curvatum]